MKSNSIDSQSSTLLHLAREQIQGLKTVHTGIYRIGDSILRVTAGTTFLLEQYLSSLNHVRISQSAEQVDNHDFEVLLLDSESTGVSFDDVSKKRLEAGENSSSIVSTMDDYNTVSIAELDRGIFVCWLRGSSYVTGCLPVKPLSNLIHWRMTPRKYQLIHAAAVGDERGAVLLVGPRQSGKSTTSLNLLTAGMGYLGDDYVMVGPATRGDGLSVFSIYSRARIQKLPAALKSKQELADTTSFYDRKFAIQLYPFFADQIVLEAPLKALICPYFGQKAGALVSVAKSHAFARALPTLAYLPGQEKITMANISDCVFRLPCYSLELADDFDATAAAIKQFLDR